MTNKKTTKREHFEMLRTIMDTEMVNHPNCDELREFLDKEIASLDKKAADARKRAEKNKAAGDELKERIFATLLEDDFQTTPEIIKLLGDENLSSQKVTARLTQLVNAGMVEKEDVKRPDPTNPEKNIKKVGYRKIGEVVED